MKTVCVVFPVEPGLIWLLRQDGLWGGWRDGKLLEDGNGNLEKLNCCFSRQELGEEVKYEIFFYHLPPRVKNETWKPFTEESDAEHFDLWGLPPLPMQPFEQHSLTSILHMLADKKRGSP